MAFKKINNEMKCPGFKK